MRNQEFVEKNRLKKAERVRKIKEIIDYVFKNREDVIITRPYPINKKVNISFCGKIGKDVKFLGYRKLNDFSLINNDQIENFGLTQINITALEGKTYRPLCYIETVNREKKNHYFDINKIDFVPYYNSDDLKSSLHLEYYDPELPKKIPELPQKILDGKVNCISRASILNDCHFKRLYVYHDIKDSADDLVDEIYNIIKLSKEKSVNNQKLRKLNIHSTANLITTQYDEM